LQKRTELTQLEPLMPLRPYIKLLDLACYY
jgi:hypothetical protein